MPVGRKPIKTYAVNETLRSRINNFIRKEVEKGRQVYIIYPLVENSENIDAKSIESFNKEIFSGLHTGIIHGKMKSDEKAEIMEDFASGKIDILVSTTVIEVGINVPNATAIVIENSERFGLSQLHQLRGRVGRGEHQSYCILFLNEEFPNAIERVKTMEKTDSGFEIAEYDLKLRGFGDIFGMRQHGLPSLKIANIYGDLEILTLAKKAVESIQFDEHNDLLNAAYEMFIEGM
jgi:ATP-dependent DNA helicase RecG